jgi:cystathionine gamma-lyase
MSRFGNIVCFTLASPERAEAFLVACELLTDATSFGGVHTTAERRARWGGDEIAEGFIRLSVGCEDPGDVIADIEQALDAAGSR